MRDSVAVATLAGIIGAAVMTIVMYIISFFGLEIPHPWQVGADVFLTRELVDSPLGVIIGLMSILALSIASAFLIVLILKQTGYDYAILKGIIAANAFGFITIGLFMPLLHISPQLQRQPLTNLIALINLSLIGAIMALIIKQYRGERVSR